MTPLSRKPYIDRADVLSYRPISNLSACVHAAGAACSWPITALLICRLACFHGFILQTRRRSLDRDRCVTETAVSKVLSNIQLAIDAGDLSALMLLDLLAAFDTVDHDILI